MPLVSQFYGILVYIYVEAWTMLHEDELNAAWVAWSESGELI